MTSPAPQATDHQASATASVHDGLPSPTAGARADAGSRGSGVSLASRIATGVRRAPFERRFLWVLLLVFAAKGVIFTYVFPPFTGHDEVAHYGYMNILMEEGRLPIIPDPVAYNEAYTTQIEIEQARQERSRGDAPELSPAAERREDAVYAEATAGSSFDQIPDYFQKYQRYTTGDWWNDDTRVVRTVTYLGDYVPAGWVYTANHPPLYYLMMAPVWELTDSQSPEYQLYALRLAAIPLGMLTVLFAYLTVRRLFPRDAFLAVTVPTLVAFQPQIAYEAAMLNNDILAIATTSACLYLIVAGLQNRFTVGLCAWLGLALGLAVLSKTTAVIIMPAIAIAMIFRLGWKNIAEWLPKGGLVLGITAVMAAPWYAYMLKTYGNLSALDQVLKLQWWNNQDGVTASITDQLFNQDFAWMRWRETWGEFGWRLIPLGNSLLTLLWWITVVAMIGLMLWAALTLMLRRRAQGASFEKRRELVANTDPIVNASRWQMTGILVMVVTCVVAYFAVLQFGTTFDLTQARYYFPAINALAILVMLGFRMLTPIRWLPYMQTLVFVGLFWLNVIILSSYVVPYWQDRL